MLAIQIDLLAQSVVVIALRVFRLEKGIRVLDLGCGAGTVTRLIAKAFPNCECWGLDFSKVSVLCWLLHSKMIHLFAGG